MIQVATFLFFLSGFSSLVLETVWFRQLGLIFGSSAWAAGTITGAFLGGLGLGALLSRQWVDKIKRRLLVYGVLELFIAVYALASPAILGGLDALQYRLLGGSLLEPTAYAMLRFAVVFVALLPPTIAMGATLPLIVRALTEREDAIGRRVGYLYGINTLGAFLGVLSAGFFLLPSFGQARTLVISAAVSAFVGVAAAVWDVTVPSSRVKPVKTEKRISSSGEPRPYFLLGLFLLTSGLVSMMVQVGYTRVLAVILGTSVYSFTLVVAVFLAGIAIGSIVFARWLSSRVDLYRLLAVCQAILGVSLVVGVQFADRLPDLLRGYALSGAVGINSVFLVHGALVAVLLLVPTIAMGLCFPAALRLFSFSIDGLGRDVGGAYFLNTMGSIAGSFLTAFVLIESLGLQATILLSAGACLVWSGFFASTVRGMLAPKRVALLLPLAMLAAMSMQFSPLWDIGRLTSGMYRVGLARKLAEGPPPSAARLYHRDGPVATVTVEERGDVRTLRINGKVEASNRFDMPTQILVGLLPILLHENDADQTAALVGYGSGVTAGAMLQAPIRRLNAVELEPRVIEASRLFEDVNFNPRSDERLSLSVGDARTAFGYGPERYDVLVSEPSNPWVSGASGLFTVDFYRMVKRRLNEGGVFAQWVQLYELSPEHLRTLVRSFIKVFPHSLVFSASERGVDLILVGRNRPWSIDVGKLEGRIARPEVSAAMKAAGVGTVHDLLALLKVTDVELQAFVGDGPLNTDDNGLIEFSAAKDMLFYERYALDAIDFHFSMDHGRILPLLVGLGEDERETAENLAELSLHLLSHGRTNAAYDAAGAATEHASVALAKEVREVCELVYLKPGDWPPVANGWLLSEKKDDRYALLGLGMASDPPESSLALAEDLARSDSDSRLTYLQGVLSLRALRFDQAEILLVPLAENDAFRKANPEIDFYAGRALDRRMKFQSALRHLARYNQWRRERGYPIVPEHADEVLELEIPLDEGHEER